MDDMTRIENALRQGPPVEAEYRPQLYRSSLGIQSRRQRGGVRPLWDAAGALRAATAVLVIVVAIGGFLWLQQPSISPVGSTPSPTMPATPSNDPSPSGSVDLLSQVRTSGALRFAIRPDFPQATMTGLEGFDVDVGTELARRLALGSHPVQLAADEILSGVGADTWDLALPSELMSSDEAARFASSDAYYYWPVRLLVPVSSTATSAAELAGQRICVVAGSSGETWLAGDLPPSARSAVPPPPAAIVRTKASDRDCLAAIGSGEADAAVTADLSDSDLAARPSFRMVGDPLFIEPRTIVAPRAGLDPSPLVSAVDDALGAMRSDGTLADLSRNRFGGRDLSTPASS
jgi:polar amino acid transport system substrate-binding protein